MNKSTVTVTQSTPNKKPLVDTCTNSGTDRLGELAASINKKQGEIESHANSMISLACDIGAQLAEAKKAVKHGQWKSWAAENISFGHKQAAKYIRLYNNRNFLEKGPSEGFLTSIDAAVTYIASEKKRLKSPDSEKTKSSPIPAKAPENIPPEEGEECDLKEELAKEGRSMPKGTSKDKSKDTLADRSNDTPADEADDESSDDTPLFDKGRNKKENISDGDFTEVDSAPTKEVEETEKKPPAPTIDITNEKDVKTVLRTLDPKGKPLTSRRLKIAHNAFKRLLGAGKHG